MRMPTATRQKQTNKEVNSQTPMARLKRLMLQFAGVSPIVFIQQGKFGFWYSGIYPEVA